MFNLSPKAENLLFSSAFAAVVFMFCMIYFGKPKDPMQDEMLDAADTVTIKYSQMSNYHTLPNKAITIAATYGKSFKIIDVDEKVILVMLTDKSKYKMYHVNNVGGIDITECTYGKETCKYSFSLFNRSKE